MSSEPPSPGGRSSPRVAPSPRVVVVDQGGGADVDIARWGDLLAAALRDEGVPSSVEVTLVFVDEQRMAELNEQHLGGTGPTDVLAFPIDEAPASPDHDGPPTMLGDVVVCPPVAARNAPEHAGSVDDELALLVVHGALHLLGHDHADADEKLLMQARERELLDRHHGPLAGNPWK